MVWLFLVWLFILLAIWKTPALLDRFVYPHVKVEYQLSESIVNEGQMVRLQCRITNPTRIPIPRVRISIALPYQLRTEGESHVAQITTHVMGRQNVEVQMNMRAVRRGIAKISYSQLAFFDNFGLYNAEQGDWSNLQVVIRPAWDASIAIPKRFTELIGDIQTKRFFNDDPSLLVGIRPYQHGDSFRHISWHATARSQELMVKQFGYTTNANYLIVLNGQQGDSIGVEFKGRKVAEQAVVRDLGVFDTLCERVVQLSAHLLESNFSVGLLTNVYDPVNKTYYEAPSNRPWQLQKLWNRMGSVEPLPFPLTTLLYSTFKYASTGMTIVLLTAYLDEKSAAVIDYMTRKFQNIIVYYVDTNDATHRMPTLPRATLVVEELTSDEGRGDDIDEPSSA